MRRERIRERERESRVCVCVCVCEKERERESNNNRAVQCRVEHTPAAVSRVLCCVQHLPPLTVQ